MKKHNLLFLFLLTHLVNFAQDTLSNHFSVAPIKNNFLYIGIENPISIDVADIPSTALIVSTSNGSISGSNGDYMITPVSGNHLQISIYVLVCKYDTSYVGEQFFRLKKLPDPEVWFAQLDRDSIATVGELLSGGGIISRLEDFSYDIRIPIKSFELKAVYNNKETILRSTGNAYTPDMKALIQNAVPGTKITVQNIIVIYPGKSERQLSKTITVRIVSQEERYKK